MLAKCRWILLFTLIWSTITYGDDRMQLPPIFNHLYIGAQVGYSTGYYSVSLLPNGFTATSVKRSGIGSHVFLGYCFNPYLAAEFGVMYFTKPGYRGLTGFIQTKHMRHNVVSLYIKGSLPLGFGLNGFVKGGIGYVARSGIEYHSQTVIPEGVYVVPVFGAGVSYRVIAHWYVVMSALFATSKHAVKLPWSSFYGIGFYYAFSD